jgi:hypothetical protein
VAPKPNASSEEEREAYTRSLTNAKGFHVDGAISALLTITPTLAHLVRGVERAPDPVKDGLVALLTDGQVAHSANSRA